MGKLAIKDVAGALGQAPLSPQDILRATMPMGGRSPDVGPASRNSLTPPGGDPGNVTRLPITWRDPIGPDNFLMNQAADPITLAHGTLNNLFGADLENARGGTYDPLTGEMTPLGSGSKVVDALDGLGRIFAAGSGAEGVLGTGGLATAAGSLNDLGSMGTFGGLHRADGTVDAMAPVNKLKEAQRLENEGIAPADIFKETGWFADVDGQWKYEISDHEGKLTKFARELFEDQQSEFARGRTNTYPIEAKVKDFYQNFPHQDVNPEFYNAKMKFRVEPRGSRSLPRYSGGAWHRPWDMGEEGMRPALVEVYGNDLDEMLGTIVHESEHANQDLFEFARGGSPLGIEEQMHEIVPNWKRKALKDHVTGAIVSNPKAELIANALIDDVNAPKGWSSAGYEKRLAEALRNPRPKKADVANVIRMYDSLSEDIKLDAKMLIQPWLENYTDYAHLPQPDQSFDIYAALLGEANARAADTRKAWTPEQRRMTHPEFTRQEDPLNKYGMYFLNFNPRKPMKDQLFLP